MNTVNFNMDAPPTVDYKADAAAVGLTPGLQTQFASLQMAQAHTCKAAAKEKLGELKVIQQEQHKLGELAALLQSCKNFSWTEQVTLESSVIRLKKGTIPPEVAKIYECIEKLKKCGITAAQLHTERRLLKIRYYIRNEEMDIGLKQISGLREQVNAKAQSALTVLQDFMGQYNSYLDGSRTAMAKATAVMNKLATTRS